MRGTATKVSQDRARFIVFSYAIRCVLEPHQLVLYIWLARTVSGIIIVLSNGTLETVEGP